MQRMMVWGASGGIGGALVQAAVRNGSRVVGLYHSGEVPAGADAVQADVTHDFSISQAVLETAQLIEAVDCLIYAVGDIAAERIDDTEGRAWRRIIDVNLSGAYAATQASLPLLTPDAYIVYIGAVSERLRLPGLAAYAAAKAGLEALAAVVAKEERHRRVLLVRPSAVATPLWDKVPLRLPRNAASPEEVAERILAACGDGLTGVLDL
jgi:3-oxoacyl-[acyl-carrier protein] reductase